MGGFLRNLVSRLRQKPTTLVVCVTDQDVTLVEDGRPCAHFAWSGVREIVTFKLDLGICDDIRLAFRLDNNSTEVSEDVEGWSVLAEAMHRHFPTIAKDWYATAMLPPFEPCYRVLYESTQVHATVDPAT